jgi:hypothetical protein
MVDGWQVGAIAVMVLAVGVILVRSVRKMAHRPPAHVRRLGEGLGLRYQHGLWKGTHEWVGTWDRMPVRLVLLESENPRILLGDTSGKNVHWMLMDRELADALEPLKGEPAPLPTGDKRFDERFNFRSYDVAGATALTSSMRDLLLKAAPEIVTVWPTGLEVVLRDMPNANRARAALYAATELARMAGIRLPVAKEAAR